MSKKTKTRLLLTSSSLAFLLLSTLPAFSQPNTWVQKANYGGGSIFSGVGFSIGDKGYIGLGDNGFGTQFQSIWEYDPSTNVWTQKADFGGGTRSNAVAFSIGGKAYVGTGYNSVAQADFWEYDQASNMWTQKADFGGGARIRMVGFSIGTKGYIGTGNNGSFFKDFWEYDPAADTWTAKADFPGAARMSATGFSIGTKGYLGTGWGASSTFKDFWEYDPVTNAWLQKADVGNTNRYEAVGFSIGGKGYIGTGGEWPVYTKDLFEYDPLTDCWAKKADFGGAVRALASGFSVGGKGYIGTSNFQIDFWEYTPAVSLPLPTLTSFAPTFGDVGTTIIITGTNFSTTSADNIVTFNGITAMVTVTTATSITCSVPAGATTGSIKVQVGSSCNTATSATDFVVPVCFPANGQNADVVLGQTNFTSNTSGSNNNKFAGVGSVAIHHASGKVFVADIGNNRILRFSAAQANTTGGIAEAVIGQPNFTTTSAGLSQSKLNSPIAIAMDQNSGALWVADANNNRILRFDDAANIPTGANASGVLGQPGFTTNAATLSAINVGFPWGVAVDANGDLWVGERAWNRVTKFPNAASLPNGSAATVVIGQANFASSFPGTSPTKLDRPNNVAIDASGNLWVADELNDRVLKFPNAASLTTGAAATVVLGQVDFLGNSFATAQNRMFGPIGLHADIFGDLWVGDWANHRTLQFVDAAAKTNGANADRVLGSPNFTAITSGVTQSITAYIPGLAVDNFGNVYIADDLNRRVLRFNAPVATSAGVSICANSSATLTATGAVALQEYRWYDVAAGGSSIFSGPSFTTPSLSAPATYYVSLYDGGCGYESVRVPVPVAIIPSAIAPLTTSGSACGPSSLVTVTASGGANGQYRWYTSPAGGAAITGEVNDTYTTPAIAATTSYYVAVDDGTCESTRTEVIAQINAPPPAPTVTGASDFSPAVLTLSASGGTDGQYRWYTTDTGGTPLTGEVNSTYTTPSLTATTTYYVAIHNGTCESLRTAVVAEIKTNSAPVILNTDAQAPIEGIITISLTSLISDPENNLDFSTLAIVSQPTSGARATIEPINNLVLDYTGITFAGTDQLTIGICDQLAACSERELSIEVVGQIIVYNALSPNGDGKNDFMYIQHIDIIPETQSNRLQIFNRWGDEVFSVSDYNNKDKVFIGDSNHGHKLPTGIYFYKVSFSSGEPSRSGFLEIKY